MKVQLFASTALMLISAIPGALSAEHLHLKEAVAATAADFEDDFEEKSPSAKSFSLRGAVAAASAEDAADEDEELNQWDSGWKWKPPKVTVPKPPKVKIPQYTIPKDNVWGNNPHTGQHWGSDVPCSSFGSYACHGTPACSWRGNKCGHRNFEDEEFDTQDLEKFEAPEGEDQYYYYANDEEDDEEAED